MAKPSGINLQFAAAQVLREVIDQGRSLDKTLQSHQSRVDSSQWPVLRELAFGGCRYYCLLDGVLGHLLSKPIRNKDRLVHFLLVAGLYQIAFMRTPDHAAVNQTVKALEASKQSWARGLVNGVLRGYLRTANNDQDQGVSSMVFDGYQLSPAARASFSPFLFAQLSTDWPDQAKQIAAASIEKPPMILRVNLTKVSREDYIGLLEADKLVATVTEESETGIILQQPVTVDKLPKFNQGWVSVQDESAQLCVGAMNILPGHLILDGCAAPGGKTCAMLEAEPTCIVTAVDLPERVESIKENLERIGLQAEIKDGELEQVEQWWEGEQWDRILLDVPCSGSGVIRRHPDILHRREPGDLERFAAQQKKLLLTAWPLLKKGGQLLYVTCSIMNIENDHVIDDFLGMVQDIEVAPVSSIKGVKTKWGIQRLPGLQQGDGFYYCRLNKL